jgi:quinol-cytochrome oxidoreductase complex cytochrome b subunit/coenzyme F420-reducing hydrogenase delta subunit/Fe-S-cluster-containing hydrogenase component 2
VNYLETGLRWLETAFDRVFTDAWNPWYQLGALAMLCYWIVAVSGVYLFVFFDTSIIGAWDSVERITAEQWYLGGVMRSLHRYASDAMVVFVTVHILREFALGRFRGVRWFSWVSGVPLLWLLFAAGIGGYWLVWDRHAQYIAVTTTEWMSWLPGFGDGLPRNFLSNASLSDRFFSFLVFLHIALPLFLLGGVFVHIKRMKLARINPSRGLVYGLLATFLVLSFVKPAESMDRADLANTVSEIQLDWFYLNVYPLVDSLGAGQVWGFLAALTLLLLVTPWVLPGKTDAPHPQPAVVNPDNCNGCSWCFQDCPYDAITMIEHTDKPNMRQALVNPDLCTACGICEGSCPSATPFRNVEELVSGIEVPDYPLNELRERTEDLLESLDGNENLVVFGCDHALNVGRLDVERMVAVSLPCTGALPPSFTDFVARNPAVLGVVISGCHEGDCFFRKGSQWSRERLEGERMPHLRTGVGKHKVLMCTAGTFEKDRLIDGLETFRRTLLAEQEGDSLAEKAS